MFLEPGAAQATYSEALIERRAPFRWGVDSETGRLTDVALCRPDHLAILPCNATARSSLARGLACCNATAAGQHRRLAQRLEAAGVACHFVPPMPDMADLAFTRDAVMMTPWGLLELRPSAPHRRAETKHVARALEALGVPLFGRIEQGRIEGGDICILRPGLVLIGYSGERSDKCGARAATDIFERRGWQVLHSCFDPRFLHLDTQFTMVSPGRAVACLETLGEGLTDRLEEHGIETIPATLGEVERLGANLLSLGGNRVVVPAGNGRLNGMLARYGYELIEVEIDQFARCGGGVHCLTLPLARLPA
jgi:N-dimethylarginine dimethylaminohydrolase